MARKKKRAGGGKKLSIVGRRGKPKALKVGKTRGRKSYR